MRGVFVEPWMFAWNTWDPEKTPLVNHPPYRKLINELKAMNVNTVWLYPPDARGSGMPNASETMIYPSKITKGIEKNVLAAFCSAMHAEGIRVVVMWMASIPPYSVEPWQYPQEESSRFPKSKQFENSLYGNFYRESFGGMMLEVLGMGAHGVALFPDEYYYKGPILPVAADNKTDLPMVAAFKKAYGYDSPPSKIEDTRQYRAWVLLQYQGVANLMKDWSELIDQKFPGAYRTTNISVTPYGHNLAMEHGLAYDLIGHTAKLDGFGTDPYFGDGSYGGHWFPATMTKRMMAAQGSSSRESAVMVLQANTWYPLNPKMQKYFRLVWSYGAAISQIAHGGTGVGYYRHNYLTENPIYAAKVGEAFNLYRHLESRGMPSSVTPPTVALLESRAGQDWYQLKCQMESRDSGTQKAGGGNLLAELLTGGGTVTAGVTSNRAQQCEMIRGFIHHKVIMERLLEDSVPFNQLYLDHPADLAALSQYRLAILPFPYSIPRESVAALEKALAGGLQVLIVQKKGETDPLGEKHQGGPLLAPLFVKYAKQIRFWDDDLMADGGSQQWIGKFREYIAQVVGDQVPIQVVKKGDVEVVCRQGKDGTLWVFMINWDECERSVSLTFPQLPGKLLCTETLFGMSDPLQLRTYDLTGGKQPTLVHLKGGEVRVLELNPATKEGGKR